MDAEQKIDELIDIVERAKAMPMSASCVVNRQQVLDLLDDLKRSLPEQFEAANRVLAERDAVIEEGRREADRVVALAHDERGSLISSAEVSRGAQGEAGRLRDDALREAEQIRAEADEYVDQKLANFEVVLTKTLQAVGRGRDKMRGRNPMDELGEHVQRADAAEAEMLAQEPDYVSPGFRPEDRYAQDQAFDPYGTDFGTGEFRIADQTYVPHEHHEPAYGYPQQEQGYQEQGPYATGEFQRPQGGYAPQAQHDQNGAYPAEETSYFDTGLIDVRQFRDGYRQ